MRFAYSATDPSGRPVTGVIRAASEQEAMSKLRRLRYQVTQVERVVAPEWAPILHRIFFRVRPRVLALFFDSLAQTLRAGMTPATALNALSQHGEHRFIRRISKEMGVAAGKGVPVSHEMAKRPTIFPELFVEMVKIGEYSGSLDEMCQRAAEHLRFSDELEHLVRRNTLYPRVVLFLALVVMVLVPQASNLVKGHVMPFLYGALRSILLVVLVWYGLVWFWRVLTGYRWFNRGFDTLKMSIPWVSSVCNRLAYARFSRALATLFNAGVPMVTALELSGKGAANSVVEDRIRRAIPLVKSGTSLSEALGREGGLPGMVRQMMAVGEQSGQLGRTLTTVAEYYERDADTGMRAGALFLGLVVYLGVMLLVAYIVINFYVNLYSGLIREWTP